MSTEVTLPALGESVTEGTVSRWLKQVGDTIEVDEALVEVSTDKVDTEIPSPVAGTILEIRVQEDETADVGAVLAVIGEAGEGDSDKAELAAPETEAEPAAEDDGQVAAQADEEPAKDEAPAEVAEPAEPSTEKDEPAEAPAASSGAAEGTEVTLPALGESVTEGTVSRWLKQVGDTVEVDEALVEVSTDKVDTEIPSPVAGTVLEIRVQEDETTEVGSVLAVIGDASAAPAEQPAAEAPAPEEKAPEEKAAEEKAPESKAEQPAESAEDTQQDADVAEAQAEGEGSENPGDNAEQHEAPVESAAENSEQAPAQPKEPSNVNEVAPRRSSESSDSYVTPLVRKLAQQHGVELSEVKGTGVGGRIRKQDVIEAGEAKKKAADEAAKAAAAPAAQAAPAAAPAAKAAVDESGKRGTTEKITRLRATIARRMVESLQVSAQLTATVEVDVTAISRLRAQHKDDFKKRTGASLSYLPFITKAAVEALQQFPKVNATIDTEAGTITYAEAEHIGIAVDTDKGLLVPVIKDAGDLNITGIAKKIADLAARTRSNKVTPDELGGGTFTITNYGSAGTLFDTPIINQPQVAILGTGALVKRPIVVEDAFGGETIAVRHMMYLSMSYDHRLVDGADAARFLQSVKSRLEAGDFDGDF